MIVKEVGTHQPGIDKWNQGCDRLLLGLEALDINWEKEKIKSVSRLFTPYSAWMEYFKDKEYILIPDDETADKDSVFVTSGNDHFHISRFTHYDYPINEYDWISGVCDNATQLLAHYNALIKDGILDKNQTYLLCMTPMFKEDQGDWGWRWHKWGEYIGIQNPQCEYLADEDGIDLIYCFRIYKVTKKEIYK